jgi:hypothetical protein
MCSWRRGLSNTVTLPVAVTQYFKNVFLVPDVKVNTQSALEGLRWSVGCAALFCAERPAAFNWVLILPALGVCAKLRKQRDNKVAARESFFTINLLS